MKPYIIASVMTIAAILIVASCGMCSTGEIGRGQALVQIGLSIAIIFKSVRRFNCDYQRSGESGKGM